MYASVLQCGEKNFLEGNGAMIFGKHINRYYRKYALWLIAGLAALVMVDFLQLEIPKL